MELDSRQESRRSSSMSPKKNRASKGGNVDSAASKEVSELEKRNNQLQEQLTEMAKQQQELAKQLQELTKNVGGETPATTAAVIPDPGASAQAEKVDHQERKPKVEPGVGDSLDVDWETVSHPNPESRKRGSGGLRSEWLLPRPSLAARHCRSTHQS